ncbi:hypothetical protein WA026_017089 [Henosepilachna vigintioctopunctata]|uniref:Gustatory receptor n=1 Tax=Henosepilachna vigintioctopunctata TaxID=420089 RepID=A0AAW1TVF2_9CUCU
MNWSSILNQWTLTEIALKTYGPLRNLKKRLILTSAIIAILAITEHIFFIINDIFKACKFLSDKYDAVGKYFNLAHPHAFRLFEFSYCAAFFVKVANILSTLTWTYTDSFIILISSGLAVRFTQLAKKIENKNLQNTDEQFWRETREDFNTIYKLSRIIDKHLSALVSISFVNNIYFICIQLYNSLKEREGFAEKLYFFYSFAYLLLRITSVTMYAAWINDESKKPLDMLLSVPPKQYSIEVSRFIELINTVPVGFTGSKFFMVTRGFLLKIVGTIITLELMFLQFGPLVKYDRANTSIGSAGDKCNFTDS